MKSVLLNAFKNDKFEELLVANWTHFIDSSKLLTYVLQNVQENINNLIVTETQVKQKGSKITLSRCSLKPQGFIVWVEFSIPLNNKMSEGTMELFLANNGSISHITTMGNLYSTF